MLAPADRTTVSLAERAREAARGHPFLVEGLRTGVVNHTAAARFLDLDGDPDAVATALRRYADDLNGRDPPSSTLRVRMEREDTPDWLSDPADSETAVVAEGDVEPTALAPVLARLRIAGVEVTSAGATGGGASDGASHGAFGVIVTRRDGSTVVRCVEQVLG
jgi:hypothetical protein